MNQWEPEALGSDVVNLMAAWLGVTNRMDSIVRVTLECGPVGAPSVNVQFKLDRGITRAIMDAAWTANSNREREEA